MDKNIYKCLLCDMNYENNDKYNDKYTTLCNSCITILTPIDIDKNIYQLINGIVCIVKRNDKNELIKSRIF